MECGAVIETGIESDRGIILISPFKIERRLLLKLVILL